MYSANPKVNEELRQRLPSPVRTGIRLSVDLKEEPPRSRSVSPARRSGGTSVVMQCSVPTSRGPSPSLSPSLCPSPRRDIDEVNAPVKRGPLLGADHSSPQDVHTGHHTLDWGKNISFLLKQLDALRDANHRLQEQLLQKEEELQRRKVEEDLGQKTSEGHTELWDEVLVAQKDRDQALMSRLQLANEERDMALLRIRRFQQAEESEHMKVNSHTADMEVEQLLQCVCDADSVQQVEQYGSALVQRLLAARQRRKEITAEEMKAVMMERDVCVAKFKRLEHELIQEREERTSKEELLRHHRDKDMNDRWQLEAELESLRANNSSQDVTVAPPSSLDNSSSLEAAPLLVQLQQLSKDKELVEVELKRCQEAEQEATERVRRLERLVDVLRKKVGTGSVRAMI
ncbi:mirror-image polydactyly gene 1 protein isoform X2 [Cynoglossus semilaevis]|nr:mirror-image polydactyly gene 1 protein isoform X2 [Cynoglossus semilaevis]XP_008313239.1 mirror-image polydactyly gene 1 protein isoform X2 [Cynoglossus semilaevis]